jgi:hypothetical protein
MKRRIVFKQEADRKVGSVDPQSPRENNFNAICVRRFWMLKALRRGDPERQIPKELDYASGEEDIKLTLVEDPVSECQWVDVTGKDGDKACAIILEKMDVWNDDEMLEGWRKGIDDNARIMAILRIGVGAAASHDERFAAAFREALADRDRAIREAAVHAVACANWPALDPDLTAIAANDEDERCRNRAAFMLEALRRQREPPPSLPEPTPAPAPAPESPPPPVPVILAIARGLERVEGHLAAAEALIPDGLLPKTGLGEELRTCRKLRYNHLWMVALQGVGRWVQDRGKDAVLPSAYWRHLAEAAEVMTLGEFIPFFAGKAARRPKRTWSNMLAALPRLARGLPPELRARHATAAKQLDAYARGLRQRPASRRKQGVDVAFEKMFDELFSLVTDPALPPKLQEAAWPIVNCNTFAIGTGDGLFPSTFAQVWWRQVKVDTPAAGARGRVRSSPPRPRTGAAARRGRSKRA